MPLPTRPLCPSESTTVELDWHVARPLLPQTFYSYSYYYFDSSSYFYSILLFTEIDVTIPLSQDIDGSINVIQKKPK